MPTAASADLVVEIAPHPAAPAAARRALRSLLGDRVSHELLRDVLVVASELVTNASVHTRQRCVVAAWASPAAGGVRVEVADRSCELPRIRRADDGRSHGWGLPLVMRLVDRWGVEPRGDGKSVWCELEPGAQRRQLRPAAGSAPCRSRG